MMRRIGVFFFLSKTLDALLSPLSWSVVLVAIGLGGTDARGRRRWVAALGLAVLLLFSLEPFANTLQRAIEHGAERTFRDDVNYDAVILLGGVVERAAASNPPAYNDSVERLLITYDLLRSGRARYAVVSGGILDPAAPSLVEAGVLAQQLVDWGIASERVVVEPNSRNTHENAVECRRIAMERQWDRLLVVTSAFHMPRALGCFRAIGLPVDALPVDYRAYDPARFRGSWLPRSAYLERSTMALRELFGRGIYRLQGYTR
jgi:uncharacterized SAM-binding protein YcdF (DUF218 family)